jgi:hypothetical protein
VRYFGSVELDPNRVARSVSDIEDAVIQHLAALKGAEVRVTLEIEAQLPDGVPDKTRSDVLENGRTLKFTTQSFEEI